MNFKRLSTYLSAFLTPDHSAPVTGGINRSEPTGGDAYGMPRNDSTGSKCLPSKCIITPDTAPYFVCTMRDVNLGPSELELPAPPPPDDIGNSSGRITNTTHFHIATVVRNYIYFF